MKNGIAPTLKQKKILEKNKMDPSAWLVYKVLPDRLECVHRYTAVFKSAFLKVI